MEVLKIAFCSTSVAAYDRRMIRIISKLSENEAYQISWLSRQGQVQHQSPSLSNVKIHTFFKKGFLFYAEFNLRLFIKLLNTKCDLISSVDLDTLLACTLASKIKKTKLVFDAHEYFSEVPELHGRKMVKSFWRFIGKWCIPHTTARYSVGPILAKKLSEQYQAEFKVIRNVPELLDVKVQNQPDLNHKVIAYLGVLNIGRGLEALIKAIKILPETYRLLIIGSGDIDNQLKALSKDNKLNDRIVFTGMVAPKEINKYLESAWCGVNILDRQSESYYLSLANKTFDYINSEIPSLLIDFPEYKFLNKDYPTAVFISELDPDAIANAIKKLSQDSLYNELKANCKTLKKQLNWSIESKVLIDIYRNAANA